MYSSSVVAGIYLKICERDCGEVACLFSGITGATHSTNVTPPFADLSHSQIPLGGGGGEGVASKVVLDS